MSDQEYCCNDIMGCQADGYGYLTRLFKVIAPQCEPLPTLLGVCTQIDNVIAGYRIRLGELPDPSKE